MEKIIVKRNLIRISEATFKEILEAVASDGEVYFNFKDGAKKAKVKFGGVVLDVVLKTSQYRNDEIFVEDYYHSVDRKRSYVRQGLQDAINWSLKSRYKIAYEDIEI